MALGEEEEEEGGGDKLVMIIKATIESILIYQGLLLHSNSLLLAAAECPSLLVQTIFHKSSRCSPLVDTTHVG